MSDLKCICDIIGCLTAEIGKDSDDLTTCSSVSAAPSGIIDVTFTAAQTVTIGIVAVAPNTKVTLTCTAIPSGTNLGAKTVSYCHHTSSFYIIVNFHLGID
jgi:hypothetical protein